MTVVDIRAIALEHRLRITTKGGEPSDMLFGQPEFRQPRIPCGRGSIFVGRDGGLRAFCGRSGVIPSLASVPGVVPTHTRWEASGKASDLTVSFPLHALPRVAAILKALKRRQVSPEHLAAMVAARAPLCTGFRERHLRQEASTGHGT